MVTPDVNVLLYAYDSASERHQPCRDWLAGAMNGTEEVGLSFVTVLGFLRIATSPRVLHQPRTVSEAIAIVRTWLDRPQVRMLVPSSGYWLSLGEVAAGGDAAGGLLMDAHLVALAREHGATVVSTDRDFRRFRGVRLVDPTAA
jgi:uncharacterized protein